MATTQNAPIETPNNLFSTSYAKVVDLISEGEIQGLKNGLQSVFLNNTPIQNADGSLNFTGVTVDTRTGTQGQPTIPGFAEVAADYYVGVTVEKNTPISRTITESTANAVRIVLSVPALQRVNDKGDIKGTNIDLLISVQYNGGSYYDVIADNINGRTSQQYQRQYLIPLNGAFPVNIRVARLTPDSTSVKLTDAFSWWSYSVLTYGNLRYPNSALVAVRANAEQFSSVPSRSYEIRGIKVAIPSNATVDQATGRLIYSGIWNGTFGGRQWCSDPAWILWDLLTSTRYGFGDHLDASKLDKWAFLSASQYASALVPSGQGGYEPRFSCNANIQTADDAYRLINDLCSVMRCMPYWAAGSLTISQDRPATPAFLFTLANVGLEGFGYSGTGIKNRPTVAVVRYVDSKLRDASFEVVEDAVGIARYGVIKAEIDAVACTSRGQAARLGRWLLYAQQYEAEVVSFTSSLAAGVIVRPGMVIAIADPLRAGTRRGGAVAAATTTTVTVDDATGLTASNSPTLSVMLADGTVATRSVSSISGNVITLATALPAAPPANAIWIYETSNIQSSLWRVLGIEEKDDVSYTINAVSYNPSKYNAVEYGLALQQRDVTDLNILPKAPTNLSGTEVLYEASGRASAKLQLAWTAVAGVTSYRVSFREANGGNWAIQYATTNSFEILDTIATVYEVQVCSVGVGLLSSSPASQKFTCYGKTAPPSNPTGLSLIAIDQASAILSWNLAPDLDVRLGGKVLIRHSPATSGATWENAVDLVPSAAGAQTQKQVPLLSGTVLVKFEDDTGNRSTTAATVVITLPAPQPRLLVKTYAEDLEPFAGVSTNMAYMPDLGGLTLIPSDPLIDDLATDGNFDGITVSIDAIGTTAASGEYDFGSTYDLGGIFDVNLVRRLVTTPYLPAALWDDRVDLIDDWTTVDEVGMDRVNAATWVRTTLGSPSGSPTWEPWREFANSIVRARALQFKVIATTTDTSQSIVISELGATLELQQRIESSALITSDTGATAVTFAAAFYEPPSVGITAYSLASTEQFTISNVTTTGFTIAFTSGGTGLARSFTYTAVGFGKAV